MTPHKKHLVLFVAAVLAVIVVVVLVIVLYPKSKPKEYESRSPSSARSPSSPYSEPSVDKPTMGGDPTSFPIDSLPPRGEHGGPVSATSTVYRVYNQLGSAVSVGHSGAYMPIAARTQADYHSDLPLEVVLNSNTDVLLPAYQLLLATRKDNEYKLGKLGANVYAKVGFNGNMVNGSPEIFVSILDNGGKTTYAPVTRSSVKLKIFNETGKTFSVKTDGETDVTSVPGSASAAIVADNNVLVQSSDGSWQEFINLASLRPTKLLIIDFPYGTCGIKSASSNPIKREYNVRCE